MQKTTDTSGGFHAHSYFAPDTRGRAIAIREAAGDHFDVVLGRVWDHPVGPHPCPSFQIAFEPSQFGAVVPWLMLNRDGLDVLVHPETGDDVPDHTVQALWLGTMRELDIDKLR